MNILFAGDIVGRPGRTAIENLYPLIKEKYNIDFFIANAENAAGGSGITPDIAKQLGTNAKANFLDNYIWQKRAEIVIKQIQ